MRSRETTHQAPPARQRAKRACTECNTRRVRCDVVLQGQPCSNCQASGGKCEVVPSKRGRYPRKSREHGASSTRIETPACSVHAGHDDAVGPSGKTPQLPTPNTGSSHNVDQETTTDHYAPASEEGNTFFFGESNLLTYVTGAHVGDGPTNHAGSVQKQRLTYPWSADRAAHMENSTDGHVESDREKFLRQQGALTCPDPVACLPAIRAYFTWFHPCFPILDRIDFCRRLNSMNISPLLLQALLFVGTNYCDEQAIVPMGFKDRCEAKYLLYNRAKLLFEADWEQDHITTLQALFLMSFWRGRRSSRDVRYWLGVAINHAQLCGLHRSTRFTTRDNQTARLRRRIWWSIYVRELQSCSSLGLPRRIRDEDCDIELLTPADLEEEYDESIAATFGRCEPEHVVYVMKMVDIARLLARVVDIQFVPGRKQENTLEELETVKQDLQEWKNTLPDEMQRGVGEGNSSLWASLLNLGYNHVRILIHRNGFLRDPRGQDDRDKQAATAAANQISRVAEDMLSQQTIQYGQMHLITGLFAALCIHVINIRTTGGVNKRLAENRAQICLLGLHEIQKYWRINNLVLDFFFQYLDESTAKILLASDPDRHGFGKPSSDRPLAVPSGPPDASTISQSALPGLPQQTSTPSASIPDPSGPPEDQYWNFVRMNFDGDENTTDNGDLGFLWDAQLYANLDFLEKCL